MTCILSLMAIFVIACSAQSNDSTFLSPKGKFSVTFKNMGTDTITDWEGKSTAYLLVFRNNVSGAAFKHYYSDNYDVGKGPEKIARIFATFAWSPQENFIILPHEVWQEAPGSMEHRVLSLDEQSKWRDTTIWTNDEIRSEDLFWLDSLTVLYSVMDDCKYSVEMFNGHIGEWDFIKEGKPPLGYSLVGIENDEVVIKTELDNCQTEEDVRTFKPQLIRMKISDIRNKGSKASRRH